MRKINVNVDLYQLERAMSKYLKGITFDEVSWETGTDSEGNVCYTTTVDILPLSAFSITDKYDNYFYSRFLVDACGKEIDELRNKLSAEHFSINAAEGKLVFTSHVKPNTKKLGFKDFRNIVINCVMAVDKTLESGDKICFHTEDTYYIDEDFEPINSFFLNNLRYALKFESLIKTHYDKMFLEIAKKYGFEGYVFDLKLGTVRFYSSKLPQGWDFVEDEPDWSDMSESEFMIDYCCKGAKDDDNLNGINYPSQRSTVAQQVANQYLDK